MLADTLSETLQHLENAAKAAHRPTPALLAVSKLQPASAVAELARAGQRAFGENYVQEAQAKIGELAGMDLEWHLIGHLQSNKARKAGSGAFRFVHAIDSTDLLRQVDRAVNGKPPGASTMVAQVQHLHDQQFPPLDMDDDEAILPLLRKIDARLAILDDQER